MPDRAATWRRELDSAGKTQLTPARTVLTAFVATANHKSSAVRSSNLHRTSRFRLLARLDSRENRAVLAVQRRFSREEYAASGRKRPCDAAATEFSRLRPNEGGWRQWGRRGILEIPENLEILEILENAEILKARQPRTPFFLKGAAPFAARRRTHSRLPSEKLTQPKKLS